VLGYLIEDGAVPLNPKPVRHIAWEEGGCEKSWVKKEKGLVFRQKGNLQSARKAPVTDETSERYVCKRPHEGLERDWKLIWGVGGMKRAWTGGVLPRKVAGGEGGHGTFKGKNGRDE